MRKIGLVSVIATYLAADWVWRTTSRAVSRAVHRMGGDVDRSIPAPPLIVTRRKP